ncbi:integral membrane protein [Bordetella ansorpii]|uniref:Integral membrane protein n=1 Tax=Bordetella ansorpii TaxID=288768 RepID=A0A157SU63_9BORD|nr:sodium/substrate symporter small subunit [Bordetella ansorpii]SAI74002.1 integral membrane protein [Bordetella ansorpii]
MPASQVRSSASRYWRRNVRLILLLLALWIALTATPALLTGYLSFEFIGWPFPFWLAAYGAPLAFLLIVAVYGTVMNRADDRADAEALAAEDAQAAASRRDVR